MIVIVVPLITFRLRRSLPPPAVKRSAELVFLAPSDGGYELMRTRENLARIERLTSTTGRVSGFSVSPSGERILFSVKNDAGGIDLWQMDREGKGQERMVQCGVDSCENAAWSPDELRVAYIHKKTDGDARLMVRLFNGNDSIEIRVAINGEERAFAWSPGGTQIAYFDPQDEQLKTVDVDTGEELAAYPARVVGAPAWSPDGSRIAYSSDEEVDGFLRSGLFIYDLQTNSATQMQTGPVGADVSPPVWSPDGNWLLIGQRTLPGSPAKQLFLIRADGLDFESIVEDLTATHSAYRWSPDGTRIVYQQFELGSSQNRPEVWVWNRDRDEARLVAPDAMLPQWLP